MQRNFKYKASFSSEIIASSNLKDSKEISEASLGELESLVPENIDLDANVDLLAVAFNAAVVNRFNRNHDGINTETALAVSDYFVHKPTNIEHKKEKVVGHVVSSGFSEFQTNRMISKEEAYQKNGPFNIALAAVVYKTVNKDFARLVEESSKEGSDMHKVISASWEIGFNDFLIAVGSKNLEEAEIIDDENQIGEMKQYLRAFGGEGKTKDGSEIYRLVSGDVYPLGIGFTSNPAADVKGLYLKEDDKKKEELVAQNLEQEIEKIEVNTKDFLKKIKNIKKNSSHIEKTHVISDKAQNQNINIMDMKDLINELKETIEASASGKFSEEAVANIAKVVTEAIKERSDAYAQEKAEIEKQNKEITEAKEAADEKLKAIEEQLASSQEKISSLEAEQKAAQALDLFNRRMESLDEAYELSDEDRKIIAEDLKNVDEQDESFASYEERLAIIYKHKSKEFLADQEKAFQEKVEAAVQEKISSQTSEASETTQEVVEEKEEEVVEEALDSAEATDAEVTSNNGETTEKEISLREKFQQAFTKDSLTIKY